MIFRKTKQDFEMSIFTEEEIRLFCSCTVQINKLKNSPVRTSETDRRNCPGRR